MFCICPYQWTPGAAFRLPIKSPIFFYMPAFRAPGHTGCPNVWRFYPSGAMDAGRHQMELQLNKKIYIRPLAEWTLLPGSLIWQGLFGEFTSPEVQYPFPRQVSGSVCNQQNCPLQKRLIPHGPMDGGPGPIEVAKNKNEFEFPFAGVPNGSSCRDDHQLQANGKDIFLLFFAWRIAFPLNSISLPVPACRQSRNKNIYPPEKGPPVYFFHSRFFCFSRLDHFLPILLVSEPNGCPVPVKMQTMARATFYCGTDGKLSIWLSLAVLHYTPSICHFPTC